MIFTYTQTYRPFYKGNSGLLSFFKGFLLIVLVILCSFNSMDANNLPFLTIDDQEITGTITDESGETLIGVNILVKGSDLGTISDYDGTYTINVPDDATTLVFSYIGYKPMEVNIDGRSVLDVVLQTDAAQLDEVVVIGYGVVKKSNLTGAVASLGGSDLIPVMSGNPTSALQGKLTGVQVENNGGEPGGAANVFVRGVSSLTNSFPLYVIDGTFADNMNFLNPKDIERIEVLKDAASAAIYGSRAANGVVIVQTKRGSNDGQPKVSLDMRVGTESPSKYLDFLNGKEFVDYRNQREMNDATGFVLSHDGTDTDWQDLALNPGNIQDYGVSVSGGNDNSKYFISGNYFTQDGILIKTGYERYNLRANTEFTIGKFKIQQSLGISKSEIERNNWFGRDGTAEPSILRETVPENEGGFEAPSPSIHGFGGINRFGLASLEENLENNTDILGNINASYEIVDGLTAKLNFGADLLNTHNYSFRPTFYMSDFDVVDNVNIANDLTEIRTERLLTVIEPTLSYGKDLGNHRLDAVVGLTRQDIDTRSVGLYVEGLPNNDIQVIGAADPSNVKATAGYKIKSVLQSAFGRVNYVHDDKYLFSATLRRDASSKFAKENRVGYFPSVSVGWKVSSEPFWNSEVINSLKFRAGYGELGSQNIPDYAYQSVFNLTSPTSVNNQVVQGYAQTSLALEDLKWETTKTFNIGFDMGILNDKITLSAEYYNKDVEDVLVAVALPSSVGFSEPVIQNVGAINNNGIEFEAVYHNNSKFKWDLGVNFSTFNNKIVSLPNPIVGPGVSEDLVRVNRFIEGQPLGVYWGYKIDGVYADQAAIDSDPNLRNDEARKAVVQPGDFIRKDINGDGKVNGDDNTILGDPTPDFIYGLNFSGSYDNLDFGIFFQGTQGNEIYNVTKYYNLFWADDNKLTDIKDAWTTSNTNTNIPRTTTKDEAQNGAPSDFFVEDGSYLRLRTAVVGITLKTEKVAWMESVRIFLTAQNLFTLTGYSGYNPDISSVNGGRSGNAAFFGSPSNVNPLLGRGLDVRAYPNTRSFILGVQANF